jgi:predicted DNA-binding transcriptional regulator AlpA
MPSTIASAAAGERPGEDCELLGPEDLAILFKISKRTVFRMRAEGLLPPPLELTTNLVRWRAEDIRRFVSDLRVRKARRRPSKSGE